MQNRKVSCLSCKNYATCPSQTRMYVNYCGTVNSPEVKSRIADAITECRKNRGLIIRYELFTSLSQLQQKAETATA